MKANHVQWQISDHPRAPIQFQELYLQNYGSRYDSKSIKFKITCFVYAVFYTFLRCFNGFLYCFCSSRFFAEHASGGS